MRILFIGDVMGRPGRRAVRELLPGMISERRLDLVVLNAENLAGGTGVTAPTLEEMFAAGADVLTSGNHIWDKKDALDIIKREPRLLRPLNYHPNQPGKGSFVATARNGAKAAVVNAAGRVFMAHADCPFRLLPPLVAELRKETPVVLVDVHAEATAEKRALGWHLDGSVTAVVGTHTHVQTADEEILPGGTAFLTDLGMTGPYDSVIGIRKEDSLSRFLTGLPTPYNTAKGNIRFCGAVVEADDKTGRALSIERVNVPLPGEHDSDGAGD
jgi:2',3'-cyclic-nucleotide 2'-phosphodiesterase